MTLVQSAVLMDEISKQELPSTMKKLTGLENPNSLQQMKQWLSENRIETDTLGKKAVAEMLEIAAPELAEVLTLRGQLSKSSVKKYASIKNAISLQFHLNKCVLFR